MTANGGSSRGRCKKVRFNKRSGQWGQATVEFLVAAAFVLIPMAVLAPMLGKYIDAKQKVEQAARYAAWERTVWYEKLPPTAPVKTQKSDEAVLIEAQVRVFGGRYQSGSLKGKHRGIYHGQGQRNASFDLDPLLYFAHGTQSGYRPILREQDKATSNQMRRYLSSDTAEIKTPGVAPGMDTVFKGIQALSNVLPSLGKFDINNRGAHTATVSVKLDVPGNMPEFANQNLTLTRSHTLVTDAWNAGGPKHTKQRVEGLVPLSSLNGGYIKDIQKLLGISVPVLGNPFRPIAYLEFGRVDVEPVPLQYLE